MLQAINDKAKGLIGGIIILFISIPFALWGIQEYLGGAEQPFAAKVNGAEISVTDFEAAVTRHRQRLQSVFGDKLPDNPAFEKRIKQQVLDQLITRKLMEQMVLASGFSVPDQVLAQKIHAMDAFQEDGHFVAETYQNILRSQGMSPAQFEQLYRMDLLVQQLQDGVSQSSIVDQGTLSMVDRLQRQTRDVSYLLFKQSSYMNSVSVSDAEIQQYFEENKNRFMHPEMVSVDYVEIKSDDIKPSASIDEQALRRQYDAYVAGLADREQRKASHILLSVPSDADEATRQEKRKQLESIRARIEKGESFEKLAKDMSDDKATAQNGGDLGWIGKGMMPEFEEALFKLQKGQVSDVIKTGFGYHLIKLEDIKGEKPVSFEQKKAELLKALQQDEIDNLFIERAERAATLAYENDQTLQPLVDELDVKIQKSPLFSQAAGVGIAKDDLVRQAAFSDAVLKEGRNSDVIELGKNHIVVLRIDQHQPARAKNLEDVKSQVELMLKASKSRQQAQADALQALASAQQGADLKSLVDDKHSEFKALGEIKRDFGGAEKRIVEAAFQMLHPVDGKPVFDSVELASDVAVVALSSVKDPQADAKPEQLKMIQAQLRPMVSSQEMVAFIDYLKSQSEIITGKDLF